ncbi:hypothetical protein SH1V18_26890 [Vallitalea longa]|uniref:Uncharacterized protein n=1 Tax=Vallitalea longa TaxID=2936439 RepID=A0A9W5YBS3_9FIRM|nr:hypothetical protein [Vallitalea longa]GKX30209.1 hypothetical protein SH1V18_26890 [Vallitalea longa]
MYDTINLIVCSILTFVFIIGVFSCLSANNKYNGILKTIDGKFMDKDIMFIEHKYRHRVVSGTKPLNTKIFIEKNLYNIKVNKIPIYILEDLAINTLYFTILIGLTFTFLEIALLNKINIEVLPNVLICGIFGLVLGLILLGVRMICRIDDKKEIATIYLCNHLDNELKVVMNGVKIANEDYGKSKEIKKIHKKGKKDIHDISDYSRPSRDRDEDISNSAKISKSPRSRRKSTLLNENDLEDVIKEIMS